MSENTLRPTLALMKMAGAFRISQTLYVAVRLGLADLLKDSPQNSDELAAACGAAPAALYRLLRALLSMGIVDQDQQGRFSLTATGALLQAGHPSSARSFILFLLGPVEWQSWGNLLHSVNTGETAIKHTVGLELFDYNAQNPEFGELFNNAMAFLTASMSKDLLAAYDFSQFKQVVDLGGGNGSLMAALLTANPDLQGTVFDLPPVVEQAAQRLSQAGLDGRFRVESGDFFKAVPAGGDAYILKLILHDWDDGQAKQILDSCYRVMDSQARLLVIDVVLPDRVEANEMHITKALFDLQMLVITGGHERTETEFRQLFAASGFRLARVIPMPGQWSLIEAVQEPGRA